MVRARQSLNGVLEENPEISEALDARARQKLLQADRDRAVEIIEEIVAKGDVQNVSAFVVKSLQSHPKKRGQRKAVDEVQQQHADVFEALDAKARQKLQQADPDRAAEIIEEIVAKGDVNNVSAFVVRALQSHPKKRGQRKDLDDLLFDHPYISQSLDEDALDKLRKADSARAEEVLEDLSAKGEDIRNPSAFVIKALQQYPHVRGGGQVERPSPLHVMCQNLDLDEDALDMLRQADPARAKEILKDLETKGTGIQNPSAFVSKALRQYPHRRGDAQVARPPTSYALWHPAVAVPSGYVARGVLSRSLQKVLSQHPEVHASLDPQALQSLSQADPARAVEIVQDLAVKHDVRNPSAFVAKALSSFPLRRGGIDDLEGALARRPQLQDALDEGAMAKLMEADPARAVEIVEDVASRSDVHNPSAFVIKALGQHAHKRGAASPAIWPLAMQGPPIMPVATQGPPSKRARLKVVAGSTRARSDLDDHAVSLLAAADHERAREVLQELDEKGSEVRNPSAFVSKALRQYPEPRGRKAAR